MAALSVSGAASLQERLTTVRMTHSRSYSVRAVVQPSKVGLDLAEVIAGQCPVEVFVDPSDPFVVAIAEALAVAHDYFSVSVIWWRP